MTKTPDTIYESVEHYLAASATENFSPDDTIGESVEQYMAGTVTENLLWAILHELRKLTRSSSAAPQVSKEDPNLAPPLDLKLVEISDYGPAGRGHEVKYDGKLMGYTRPVWDGFKDTPEWEGCLADNGGYVVGPCGTREQCAVQMCTILHHAAFFGED